MRGARFYTFSARGGSDKIGKFESGVEEEMKRRYYVK
jgi:hypothetical protein